MEKVNKFNIQNLLKIKGQFNITNVKDGGIVILSGISFTLFIWKVFLIEKINLSILSISIINTFLFLWIIYSICLSKFLKKGLSKILSQDAKTYLPFLLLLLGFLDNIIELWTPIIWQCYLFIIVISSVIYLKISNIDFKKYGSLLQRIENRRVTLISISILIIGYIFIFSYISLIRHAKFLTGFWDLGIFDQVLWNTKNGNFLYSDILGMNFLGEHFSPILFLISPLYVIGSDPQILLIFQSIILGLGAIPIYLLSQHILKSNLASISFVIAYLLYPFLSRINLFDFHTIALVIPSLLFTLYFLLTKRYTLYFISLFISLLIQEEVAIMCSMIGLFTIFKLREKRIGIITFLIGVVWFVLTMKVFIPYFRGGEFKFLSDHYAHLGGNFINIFRNIVSHPIIIIREYFFSPLQIATFILLLIPVSFLPLLSPSSFVICLPSLGIHFISNYFRQRALSLQYSSILIPIIFIASIYGLSNIINFFSSRQISKKKLLVGICGVLITSSILSNFYFAYPPLLPPTIDMMWYDISQHCKLFSISPYFKDYQLTYKERFFKELKKAIPLDASVCVQNSLGAHFSQRKRVYEFPNYIDKADFILIDPYFRIASEIQNYNEGLNRLMNNKDYVKILEVDNIMLFTKKGKEKELLNRYKKHEDNLTSLESIHLLSLLYLANKQVEKTIASVKNGLEIFPYSKKLHSLLGDAYLMKGDLHSAKREYEKGENRIDRFFEIANRYKNLGKLKEAIEVYHKIIQIDPKHLNSYISLGMIYEQMGNYKEAIQMYERLTELDPKNVAIYYKLASLYYKQGVIDKVILLLSQIIDLKPDDTEAYKNLGLLYYQKGEFKKAFLQFNKILTFDPKNRIAKQMVDKINNMGQNN